MSSYKIMDWNITLRDDSKPKALMIEVTNSCNYECIHCFRLSSRGFKECYMSLDLFKRIIEEAVDIGVEKIVFSGWGEPTVHPKILDMIAIAKNKGLYTILNTNGFNLSKIAKELVELEVDEIYVSIDAFDIDLYSKIRVGGDLPSIVKGLLSLKEAKYKENKVKPYVKAIFTINKSNISHVSKAVDFAKKMEIVEIEYSMMIPYDRATVRMDCFSDKDCLERLIEELNLALNKVLESGVRINKPNLFSRTNRLCPFVFNRMLFIRCDGYISPCLYYSRSWTTIFDGIRREINEVILGNVAEKRLDDAWRSNSRQLLMLQLLQLPSCLDCELKLFCNLTQSNNWDCWGNTPSCASCPYLHGLSYCPS